MSTTGRMRVPPLAPEERDQRQAKLVAQARRTGWTGRPRRSPPAPVITA
jgi:hypothetical protein